MNNECQAGTKAATLMLHKFKRQASFFAMLLLAAVSSCNESATPEVGDVWRWNVKEKSKNPFANYRKLNPYYDYKVIAVQNGYVKYMDLFDSSIETSTVRMFKVSAERLSNCR